LLWRCLVFYAYHPFPQHADNATINVNDFVRATTLLATHGADSLGKVEKGDYYLHHDEEFYRQADFRRIFRSISRPTTPTTIKKSLNPDVVADLVSVLAMVAPYFIHSAPSLEQLESTAHRLLDECASACTSRAVHRRDLSILLEVLMRLGLEKSTWGRGLPFGSIDTAESTDGVLANASVADVLRKLTGDDLTDEELSKVTKLLVSGTSGIRCACACSAMTDCLAARHPTPLLSDVVTNLSAWLSESTRAMIEEACTN
jgi:hypothetical protein